MRSSGVPASEKYPWLTQLLARRPFKVAAVATTDHVIGALGRQSLFDHMALGLTAHELLQSLFILVLGPASVRTEASVALRTSRGSRLRSSLSSSRESRAKKVGQNRH